MKGTWKVDSLVVLARPILRSGSLSEGQDFLWKLANQPNNNNITGWNESERHTNNHLDRKSGAYSQDVGRKALSGPDIWQLAAGEETEIQWRYERSSDTEQWRGKHVLQTESLDTQKQC